MRGKSGERAVVAHLRVASSTLVGEGFMYPRMTLCCVVERRVAPPSNGVP